MTRLRLALPALVAVSAAAAFGYSALPDTSIRTPLAPQHPLVGSWRMTMPELKCQETIQVRADGTIEAKSGRQTVMADADISAAPNGQGYYRWTDRVTQDNGQPDCSGALSRVGVTGENFVRLHSTGRKFLLCENEAMDSCVGPFERVQ